MKSRILGLMVFAVLLTGCFRTTVITGAPEADTKIDLPWQKSWVFGLVPPDTINARTQCPNGVAKVMVEHTFLNGLVGAITWNIFTPIHPVVTCASSARPR
ncbi:MAG: Bor/Iss family lipoprotein [Gemmatimonadaceae bacterium]